MIDGIITFITIRCICAYCCSDLAAQKNRNIKSSIICGLIFGGFAIAYYLLIDKNNEPPVAPGV